MTEVLFPYSLSFNRSLVTDLKLILYNSDNSYRNRKMRITFTELDSYCLIGIYIWGDIRKFPDQLHRQLGNDLTPTHTLVKGLSQTRLKKKKYIVILVNNMHCWQWFTWMNEQILHIFSYFSKLSYVLTNLNLHLTSLETELKKTLCLT